MTTAQTNPSSTPTPGSIPSAPTDPARAMDRMYRYTRHVYDFSRKFYLLGRDTLLDEMDLRPGDSVIEVGCGTARNLIKLAQKYPDHNLRLFGLDASEQMLTTARHNIKRAGLSQQITVQQGLAEQLTAESFGLPKFDVIYFSYSLSMIPTWQAAIDQSLTQLRPGRTLYSVDFWDQADLPNWFRKLLTRWLALFHVHHRPELLDYMRDLSGKQSRTLNLRSIKARYAYIAEMK